MKIILKNKTLLFILGLCLFFTVGVGINILTVNFQQEGSGTGNLLVSSTGGLTDNGVYDIPSNPTSYQKELYKELSNQLKDYEYVTENRDMKKEGELVECVVKNFIADFFTWTNKVSNYSVGGVQFVYSDLYLTFQSVARDSYYADLDGYISQYGRDNLVQVKSIETDVAYSGGYTFNSTTYDSYYVQAYWEYEDCKLDVEKWQGSSAFHVIYHPDTARWEIAQFWNLE